MRIIGGHDYYDGGLAYGRDDAITFLRNGDRRMTSAAVQEQLHVPEALCGARLGAEASQREYWYRPNSHRLQSVEYRKEGQAIRHDVSHAAVILCGTLRRGVHVASSNPYGCSRSLGSRWIWNADAMRSFAAEWDLALDEEPPARSRHRSHSVNQTVWLGLEEWFAPVVLEGRTRDALVDARITIAALNPLERPTRDEKGVELDWRIDQDGLRDMEFAKAVDPYTAFQEISMWLGGVIPSNGPGIVEIVDNEVKIAKAGFHHPTSFRRAKQDAR